MKREYEIYDGMTIEAQDAADHIDDQLSDYEAEDAIKSEEVRENIVDVVMKTIENWKPELTDDECQSIYDYIEAKFKVCM